MTVAIVADILGGAEILHATVETDLHLRELTRKGLPVSALPRLAAQLDITVQELARAAGISNRSSSHRSHDSRLSQAESNRLVQIARTLAYAEDVLGSTKSARGWMLHPIIALGGEVPLSLMHTSAGVSEVNTILGRIEYGIFS